jgi:hypothetical protein
MRTTITKDQFSPAQQKDRSNVEQEKGQYSLWQILGIWALVSLPMTLLTWVVTPALIPYSPLHPGITYWLLMIAALSLSKWAGDRFLPPPYLAPCALPYLHLRPDSVFYLLN